MGLLGHMHHFLVMNPGLQFLLFLCSTFAVAATVELLTRIWLAGHRSVSAMFIIVLRAKSPSRGTARSQLCFADLALRMSALCRGPVDMPT